MKMNTLQKEVLKKIIDEHDLECQCDACDQKIYDCLYNPDNTNPFASKPETMLTDEEYEILIGIRCPNCSAKLEDGDVVLCDKCYNEAVSNISDDDLPF